MCNLYSLTKGQQAIRQLSRAMLRASRFDAGDHQHIAFSQEIPRGSPCWCPPSLIDYDFGWHTQGREAVFVAGEQCFMVWETVNSTNIWPLNANTRTNHESRRRVLPPRQFHTRPSRGLQHLKSKNYFGPATAPTNVSLSAPLPAMASERRATSVEVPKSSGERPVRQLAA